MAEVYVSGAFDDLRSQDVRFLQEAARLGKLNVFLWSDQSVSDLAGHSPEFPQAERLYMLNALRYVSKVTLVEGSLKPDQLDLPDATQPQIWVVTEAEDNNKKRAFCASAGITFRVILEPSLRGFPLPENPPIDPSRKRVIVTGCFDWLHSGHMRFFEQAAAYGDVYVSVGNDLNIRQLKGEGHPLLPQAERRYMVASVREVKFAFIASGLGILDAAVEIGKIRPDVYMVNRDGDSQEKREFCAKHGLKYVVLERKPKEGLPSRQSRHLRGY